MSCSAEEIAEKRRIALERLKKHKQIASTPASNINATATKSPAAFYGSSSSSAVKAPNKPATNDGKIPQVNPYKNARISSQPYNTHHQQKQPQWQSRSNTSAPVFTKQISCVCSMITDQRFAVTPSGYHAKLIDVCKTIPSRAFSKRKKSLVPQWCQFNTESFQMLTPKFGHSIWPTTASYRNALRC